MKIPCILVAIILATLTATTQTPDTSKFPRPKIFTYAFLNDRLHEQPGTFTIFTTKQIGKIKLISGKIVVSDLSDFPKSAALSQNFPRGTFPVEISLGREKYDTATFLAYCQIVFSKEPVVRWSYATLRGITDSAAKKFWQNRYADGSEEVAIFSDSIAAKQFSAKKHKIPGKIVEQLQQFTRKTYVQRLNGHPIFFLSAPSLAAYIGYDKRGKICRLFIDPGNFQIPKEWF
jgi:hypothetical protein